jgi:hypothetical protein
MIYHVESEESMSHESYVSLATNNTPQSSHQQRNTFSGEITVGYRRVFYFIGYQPFINYYLTYCRKGRKADATATEEERHTSAR